MTQSTPTTADAIKFKELQKVVQTLVPDVMRLEFGCRVRNTGNPENIVVVLDDTHENWLTVKDKDNDIFALVKGEYFEILGRPITLEDVLKAIAEVSSTVYWIDTHGTFWVYRSYTGATQTKIRWTLGAPPSQQPQPTKDWLHDLLVTKEGV